MLRYENAGHSMCCIYAVHYLLIVIPVVPSSYLFLTTICLWYNLWYNNSTRWSDSLGLCGIQYTSRSIRFTIRCATPQIINKVN